MLDMPVTLEVSKLSGWLNADAPCLVAGGVGVAVAQAAQGGLNCGGCWQGTRGAHREHGPHVCDARDAPAGDGAVRCNGGIHVGIVLLGRRLQGGRVRKGVGRVTAARADLARAALASAAATLRAVQVGDGGRVVLGAIWVLGGADVVPRGVAVVPGIEPQLAGVVRGDRR
eukprot:scaffold34965_cov68-Phaeocystis_antarctica.AAC.5